MQKREPVTPDFGVRRIYQYFVEKQIYFRPQGSDRFQWREVRTVLAVLLDSGAYTFEFFIQIALGTCLQQFGPELVSHA